MIKDHAVQRQRYDQTIHPTRESDALLAAMQHEGCPVCQVVHTSMEQTIDTWQYEGFTDVEQRHLLIRIRGFCPLHTWQLAQHNTAFQLALVYEGILADVLADTQHNDIAQAQQPKSVSGWLRRLIRAFSQQTTHSDLRHLYAQCPLCQARTNAEQRILDTLLTMLHFDEMQTHFGSSMGMCRVHFLQAAQVAETKILPQWSAIVRCQQACLQRLRAELQEQIRKHDYHASEETHGDEMTAWRRAAKWSASDSGIY